MGGGKSQCRYVFNFSTNAEGNDTVSRQIRKSNGSLNESKRRNLNVFYANAQSIMKKMCDLEVLASEQSPDIIAVTESWINSDIPDASISLNGYTLFRKDRLDTKNGRGGGILLYTKTELGAVACDDLNSFNDFSSYLWCKVGEVHNGVVYRSPKATQEKRANFQAFRSYIAAIEWREILNGKSVEDQWQAFSRLLLDACDKFIPRQKRRTSNRPQWLSCTVKKALNKKANSGKSIKNLKI